MYQYPYGDSQQLNLDWLINAWRTFQSQICDMIASTYSNSSVYAVGDVVIYNMQLWRCTEAIQTAEEFNVQHWERISVVDLVEV